MTSLASTRNLNNIPEQCFINKLSTYSQTNCSAACSLRLLKANYTGPMVNVRRNSDNATIDFYGNIHGKLGLSIGGNGASLSTWLNGATGSVAIFYDQSGNQRNLTQVTNANQPTISGTDITYNGSTHYLATTNAPLTSGLDTYTYIVNWKPSSSSNGRIMGQFNGTGVNLDASIFYVPPNYGFNGGGNDAYATIPININISRKTVMMCNHNLNTGNILINDNGTIYSTTSTTPSTLAVETGLFTVGRKQSGIEYFTGIINEIMVFNNTLTTTESMIYYTPDLITRKKQINKPVIHLKSIFKNVDPIPGSTNNTVGWKFGFDTQLLNLSAGASVTTATLPSIGISVTNNPIYRAISGPNAVSITTPPYIEFTRANTQYMDGGSRVLNIGTNGGFTAIVYCAFTGTAGSWERIFNFFSTADTRSGDISFTRNGTSTNLVFEISNGATYISSATATGVITQNEWAIFTARYNDSTKVYEIFKNGILVGSGTGATAITDRTATFSYVGRSQYSGDAYSSINHAGMYVYDKFLTHTEISTISNHLLFPTTSSFTNIIPNYSKIFKVGNVVSQFYKQDQAMRFNGEASSFIDIQDIPALPITYSFWLNCTNTSSNTVVGLCDFTRGTNAGIQMDIEGGNLIVYAALPSTWTSSTAYAITTNTWYHITTVVNLSFQVIIYINGSLYQTLTGTAIPPGRSRFIVGASGNAGGGYTGYIYDFKVFDYVLRADEVTNIYNDNYNKTLLDYKNPVNYLVNVRNWYTVMTLNNIQGTVAATTISDPNVQYRLTLAGGGNHNSFSNSTRIQDYNSFTCSFELKTDTGGSDGLYFFCGATGVTGNSLLEVTSNGSFMLSFIVYSPNTIGIHLRNSSSTTVSYVPLTNWVASSSWDPVTITYTRGIVNTWIVNFNGADIITYSDSGNETWRASTSGSNWGIGSRSGGGDMTSYIRRVQLTYVPYSISLNALQNTGLSSTKYPIDALTTHNTYIPGNSLGNGYYIGTASSFNSASYYAWKCFRNNYSDNFGWASSSSLYTSGTGVYTGGNSTTVSSIAYTGEWVQIQLPNALQLVSFNILPRQDGYHNRVPISFVVAGSNNGTTWDAIHIVSGLTWTTTEQSFICNQKNGNKYIEFRLISRAIAAEANDGWTGFKNWSLFSNASLKSITGLSVYPPAGLTSNTTTLSGYNYGNGLYNTTASIYQSNPPNYNAWNPFDSNISSTQWGAPAYNINSGTYPGSTSTTVSGVAQLGEWVQIQLPNTILLASCSLYSFHIYIPNSLVIAGSNNGSTWTSLYDNTTHTWQNNGDNTVTRNITINTNTKYSYFRLIIRNTVPAGGAADWAFVYEWKLYDGSIQQPRGLIEGLTWKYYNAPHNDSMTFTKVNTYRSIGTSVDMSTLLSETTGQLFSGVGLDNFTLEWVGYFRANITGSWAFTISSSDDSSFVWIGPAALSGYTTSQQASYGDGGWICRHPVGGAYTNGSVNMIAGVFYPIRILYDEITDVEDFVFTFTPPGSAATSNGQGYLFSSIGTNSAYPAESAKVIKDLTDTNTDGTYYINANGVSTATYCLMNDQYDGGGWMMLMKATKGTTFQYSSTHWTTTSTLNPTDTTREDGDAKYNVFNYNYIKDVMAIWPDINPDSYTNIYSKNGGSFYVKDGWVWLVNNWNSANTDSRTTPLAGFQNGRRPFGGTDSTITPVANSPYNYNGYSSSIFSHQTQTYIYFFCTTGASSNVRWGFLFNNEADLGSIDSFGGIGMEGMVPYSAGDWANGFGGSITGIKRQARVEMYGR